VTASFDDRLRGSRHSKRTVSSIDSVAAEIDEVATGERAARLLQAAAGRETAKVDRHEAEALDHALDEIGRLWVMLESFRTNGPPSASCDPSVAITIERAFARSLPGGPVIVGRPQNGDVLRLEGFLRRNGHPYQSMNPETDADAKALIERFHVDAGQLPIVLCPGGQLLRNPTEPELARCIGLLGPIDPDRLDPRAPHPPR
jgi:hypothetical protein